MIRQNHSLVAGHSRNVFTEHYDEQTMKNTQVSLMAIQEKVVDTMTPLKSLNLSTAIGDERKRELDILREESEFAADRFRKAKKSSGDDPITAESMMILLEEMLKLDFDWLSKRRGLFLRNWISLTFDLLNQENAVGVRSSLAIILTSNQEMLVKFIANQFMAKVRDDKKPEDNDRGVLYQVFKWIHKVTDRVLDLANSHMFGPLVEQYVLKITSQTKIILPPKRNWIPRTEFFEYLSPPYEEEKLIQLVDSVSVLTDEKCWFLLADRDKVVFNRETFFK